MCPVFSTVSETYLRLRVSTRPRLTKDRIRGVNAALWVRGNLIVTTPYCPAAVVTWTGALSDSLSRLTENTPVQAVNRCSPGKTNSNLSVTYTVGATSDQHRGWRCSEGVGRILERNRLKPRDNQTSRERHDVNKESRKQGIGASVT